MTVPDHPFTLEARRYLAARPDTETVDLLIADANGILRGKRVTAHNLDELAGEGVCLPPSSLYVDITGSTAEATGLGFDIGDLDLMCRPVPGSLKPVLWQPRPSAQLLLAMFNEDGSPFAANPREVLKQVLARLRARGLRPVVAVELEFYLMDAARDADDRPQAPISPATGERDRTTQVYGIAELDSYRDFIRDINKACAAQDLPAYTAVAEYAPGQFEINLKYRDDAVQACDDAIYLKRLVKGVAERHGMVATFMAKPYPQHAGSGTHVHVSLLNDDGVNVLVDDHDQLTPVMLAAIAGLQQFMAGSMLLLAPHANSYRRFVEDAFVPLSPCWGHNNRTVALRIPAGPRHATRIEHRVAGADANPSLVAAAILAGIDYGLARKLSPTARTTGNAYLQQRRILPRYWNTAIDAFNAHEGLRDYLGKTFCNAYLALKHAELEAFQRHVSHLELDWYWRSM